MASWRGIRALLVAALLAGCSGAVDKDKPRLVVVLSIDQLRPDVLARFREEYRGGLKRLLDGGLLFKGVIDHAATETGPGHSTMLTGCRPNRTGIVGNSWLDPATLKTVYCVEGKSPKQQLTTALGDWMKATDGKAKVYSVSGKDRSAILMGGKRPDGVFWLDRNDGGFVSSRYYYSGGAPGWLEAFNEDGWLDNLPETWTYRAVPWLRDDDDPRESDRYSRAAPHPLRVAKRSSFMRRLYASPYVDAFVLRLARELVERFNLGGDAVADLLCVSLSAVDTVGHLYGPRSQEIRDTMLKLDANLGAFFDFLDAREVPYVVALTADHGVLPIYDISAVDVRGFGQAVRRELQDEFGTSDLFRAAGRHFYLDRKKIALRGLERKRVVRVLKRAAERHAYVLRACDAEMMKGKEGDELVELTRKSYHPQRSGDVILILQEKVLLSFMGTGTTHGSPHRYDREVPLLFWGAGVAAKGERDQEARTIDIAPTLARLLAVRKPAALDGAVLPLADAAQR